MFDQGCPFGVGDSVEVVQSHVGIRDGSSDGMSTVISLVLLVAPGLAISEVHVGRFKRGDEGVINFVKDEVRDKVSEAFIEPEIVPPIHGDKVAKPVMRQLVH